MRPSLYLFLALVVAVLSGVYAFQYLDALNDLVPVVVATGRAERFTRITPDMVRLEGTARDAVHPLAVRQLEAAVGKFLLWPVEGGEQLLRSQLSGETAAGSFLAELEPDQRAMLVPAGADQLGAGGLVAGGRVDIIFVPEGPANFEQARILLRGVQVLEIRTELGESWQPGQQEQPAGVLLAVDQEQAEKLAFSLEHGKLHFALLPYEATWEPTFGTDWSNLFAEEAVAGGD